MKENLFKSGSGARSRPLSTYGGDLDSERYNDLSKIEVAT